MKIATLFCVCMSLLAMMSSASSLFDDNTYRGLAADQRAHKVGESLTVLIYEQASAATSAGTETSTNTGISAGLTIDQRNELGRLGVGNDYSGGGTISRTGQLIASVTVTITEIAPSGELLVEGKQLIKFNDEKQFIELSGRVRPQEISADNSVISSRIADARITYSGEGLLGKNKKPGILTRVVDWIF